MPRIRIVTRLAHWMHWSVCCVHLAGVEMLSDFTEPGLGIVFRRLQPGKPLRRVEANGRCVRLCAVKCDLEGWRGGVISAHLGDGGDGASHHLASTFQEILPNRRRDQFLHCTKVRLALQRVAKAEGIAQEFQDVTAKGEAVEQTTGEALVAQHLHPVAEGEVGGDEHRDPFVQRRTELKEQLGAAG